MFCSVYYSLRQNFVYKTFRRPLRLKARIPNIQHISTAQYIGLCTRCLFVCHKPAFPLPRLKVSTWCFRHKVYIVLSDNSGISEMWALFSRAVSKLQPIFSVCVDHRKCCQQRATFASLSHKKRPRHLRTVPTTAEGTYFSGSMNTALCDFWHAAPYKNTYFLTYLHSFTIVRT